MDNAILFHIIEKLMTNNVWTIVSDNLSRDAMVANIMFSFSIV